MTYTETKNLLFQEKLVVISRRVPLDKIGKLAKALVRGGIKLLEVTFDQEDINPLETYSKSIAAIQEAVGESLCLGAGTVLTVEQLECAHRCGATFYLSPNTNKAIIARAKELGMVAIPGAMTPTEIADAYYAGADMVKLFPADDVGYHYIQNIRGPLPHIPLMATGGVNPISIPKFLEHGIKACGTGITIINRDMLAADDYEGIEALAMDHVKAVKKFNS